MQKFFKQRISLPANTNTLKLRGVFLLIAFSLVFTSGCSTILDATHDGPIQSDPGKRTLGTVIDDQKLETVIQVNIAKADPALKQSNIHTTSFNGVVLLTGQVPDKAMRKLAGRTAKKQGSVRQVYNELQIRGKTTMLARTSDSWLTTKVKSVMLANKSVDGGRIKIVTENGVVYLMGLLTRNEAENATDLARGIGGVQKVVKAVEYID